MLVVFFIGVYFGFLFVFGVLCLSMFVLHQFLLQMALQVFHLDHSINAETLKKDISVISHNDHYFL